MQEEELQKIIDDIIFDEIDGDSDGFQTSYSYTEVRKALLIMYSICSQNKNND